MKVTSRALVLVLNLVCISVFAQTTREHGTHLHGQAELNIALEENIIFVEWVTPSNNLLGFEHRPASADDEQKLEIALKQLKQPDTLFAFTPSAQCKPDTVNIDSNLIGADDAHSSEHSEEHQDEHSDEHADEHEHEDDHEHDESHDTETHSSFNIQYQFSCENPKDLALIEVTLFDHFPLTEKLQVQLLSHSTQTSKTLTPDNTKIDL